MVQCNLLFKKRRNTDLNNFDFVMDPQPIGINPATGFPLYREITDFKHQPYTDTYKQLNTTDDYGLFSEFLIHPGARKFRQEHVQLTVEQKGQTFNQPTFLVGFFGLRPGLYDTTTNTFQPLYDYFQLDRNSSMMCDNSRTDFNAIGSGSIQSILNSVDIAPDTIEYPYLTVIDGTLNGVQVKFQSVGTTTIIRYAGSKTFSEISQSTSVIFENAFPGINVGGTYNILLWEEPTPGFIEYTIDLDSSAFPWGPILAIWEADFAGLGTDSFAFVNYTTARDLGTVTIVNMPPETDAVGTWDVSIVSPPLLSLDGRTDQNIRYSQSYLIDALKVQHGITNPLITFTHEEPQGIYKENPIRDFTYFTTWQHTATAEVSNKFYTSHNLISPLFNHFHASASFPAPIALQAKLVVYVAYIEYQDSATGDDSPVLKLLPSDNINSFSASVDVI